MALCLEPAHGDTRCTVLIRPARAHCCQAAVRRIPRRRFKGCVIEVGECIAQHATTGHIFRLITVSLSLTESHAIGLGRS